MSNINLQLDKLQGLPLADKVSELVSYFNDLKQQTRDMCAEKYRELSLFKEAHYPINWTSINQKIIERWSLSALDYIKRRAFVRKHNWGLSKRVWITAKNKQLEYDIFRVSVSRFWESGRVGFETSEEAREHVDFLKEYSLANKPTCKQ